MFSPTSILLGGTTIPITNVKLMNTLDNSLTSSTDCPSLSDSHVCVVNINNDYIVEQVELSISMAHG